MIELVGGQSLQAAIDALPRNGEPVLIRLGEGVWREKVVADRDHLTIEGAGAGRTVIEWNDGARDPWPDIGKKGTFRTATLRTDGSCITLRGLTIANTAGPREQVGQAVALYADGDHFLCEDCELAGHQDTLFTAPLPPKEVEKNGFIGPKQYAPRSFQRHVYRRCVIRGDVDFIFGGAAAWFEDCDIVTEDGRADRSERQCTYATAASTPEGQGYGYVFNNCRFTGGDCLPGSVYLGRPWRAYAQTVLIRCCLDAHIRPEGWHDWGKPDFHQNGLYAEYECTGLGSEGQRAAFARRLSSEEAARYTLDAFLACDH